MTVRDAAWGGPEVLEQNRRRLLRESARKLRKYEARYELSSEIAEAEMTKGRLRETAEVCDWVMTYHLYRSLQNGR